MQRQWRFFTRKEQAAMNQLIYSIKKRPLNIVLICVVAILYVVNNLCLKTMLPYNMRWFFVCYFNDLICPLLFLAYCNILLLSVNKEMTNLKTLFFVGLAVGVVWEFGAPIIKKTSTTDIMDIVCYVGGSIIYWFLLKRNRNEKTDN